MLVQEIEEGVLAMHDGDKDRAIHFLVSQLVVSDQCERLKNAIGVFHLDTIDR